LQDSRQRKIGLDCRADSIMLPLSQVTVLGMIVAELVTNSYRHAFPQMGGTIEVSLTRSAAGHDAVLTIQDDGAGFVAPPETARRGVGLVRKLIEQMGGTIDVRSAAGTFWTLAFPVEAAVVAPSNNY
jgi:two-component sensor histidine kinase